MNLIAHVIIKPNRKGGPHRAKWTLDMEGLIWRGRHTSQITDPVLKPIWLRMCCIVQALRKAGELVDGHRFNWDVQISDYGLKDLIGCQPRGTAFLKHLILDAVAKEMEGWRSITWVGPVVDEINGPEDIVI